MKRLLPIALTVLIALTGCIMYREARLQSSLSPSWGSSSTGTSPEKVSLINESGTLVSERFEMPEGFERIAVEEGTFAEYLRNFPLMPHGSPVRYYNGGIKSAEVHAAVLNIDVGDKDLQQCADAVMRLRAEYLYSKGEYDKIHFNFTNGFRADYTKWMQGYRIVIEGNNVSWVKKTSETSDYESFRKYLDIVFSYAGTASLAKELKPVALEDMQIGDVFIKGGNPGHCVIVMDMAENKETGERLFLLAQSYMPAQSIHILKNPQNDEGNPWYSLKAGQSLDTPEWDFTADQLMRF